MKIGYLLLFIYCVVAELVVGQLKFKELDQSVTNIDFQNKLAVTPQINSLTYQNFHNGAGVALGDINNDGLPDLYFVSNLEPNRLYLNKGNMKFEDISAKANVTGDPGWATGATMVDINNDGFLDIYVCKSGNLDPDGRRNKLYINNRDLTFTEKAKEYGLDDYGYSTQAYFLDADKDGDLDMYLLNHAIAQYTPATNEAAAFNFPRDDKAGDKFFRNENGKFVNISEEAGIKGSPISFGLSASVGDVNNDGYPDIYVCNDFLERDYLYINNGKGGFTDELKERTRHISNFAMGSDIADINGDGKLDIMIADMAAEDNYRSKTNMSGMNPERFWKYVENGFHYQYMVNSLQLNTGNGAFSEIAQLAGVDKTDWSWAPLLADFNHDGHRDLFVTNGLRKEERNNDFVARKNEIIARMQQAPDSSLYFMKEVLDLMPEHPISNYLFMNEGNLHFEKEGNTGMENPSFSNGAAYGDLDGDGDLDLVVNNIDHNAVIYRNDSDAGNYLRVALKGQAKNPSGIGARVTIKYDDHVETAEHYLSRGYLSSCENVLHFGLGKTSKVDFVEVIWSDGTISRLTEVEVNKTVVVKANENRVKTAYERKLPQLETQLMHLPFVHKENSFDDFQREVLLPHQMSTMGPGLDVADVNGDGLEDCYIGGATGSRGGLFLQDNTGRFKEFPIDLGAGFEEREETVAHFFDYDGDGDPDLYIGFGGNESLNGNELLQDRLFENVSGTFKQKDVLPQNFAFSTGCVSSCDFDQDGDLDLFVGNRQTPGKYPYASKSYLLINENGKFRESITAGIGEIGMVTEAKWVDLNKDNSPDLIVAGEWMPLTILIQKNGAFVNETAQFGLSGTDGWWFGLAIGDIDNDGDMDIIGGNLGRNYKYKASKEGPFQVYSKDINGDNKNDIVLGYNQQGKNYPLRGRQCSSEQIPELKKEFPTYNLFASATLEEVYGEELSTALHYSVTDFSSAVFLNENGVFKRMNFPHELQMFNWNDIVLHDFNGDNQLDLAVAGNLHEAEVETPRCDAGNGWVLFGNGDGTFTKMAVSETLWGAGNTKVLRYLQVGDHPAILIGRSDGPLDALLLPAP